MNKNLFKIGSLAVVAIAMASCAKTDLYDENSDVLISQNIADYKANFVKKYGEIDPNKSWDMSANAPRYSLTPYNSSKASTRTAATYSKTEKTGIIIEQSTLKWFFKNAPAGKNNFGLGDPFYMDISNKSFTIVPIFQGTASYYWELWMHVEGLDEDVQIWKKGDNLKYQPATGGNFKNVGTGKTGIPQDALQVSAPSITFSGMPEGKMNFYLRMWTSTTKYDEDPYKDQYTEISSLNQKMIVLKDFPRPDFVPEDVSCRIIGCEDSNGTDTDYEDLAFLIYGNFEVNKPEVVYTNNFKRYMVEDLGSTDDFDFNDVVIDLTEVSKTVRKYKVENGDLTLLSEEGPSKISQKAVVRAVGGTLDFTIKIGQNTTWTKSDYVKPVTTMLNTGVGGTIDTDAVIDEFDVNNMEWSSEANNISIEVDGRDKNKGIYTIKFPRKGEVPMILAVDTKVDWMKERKSVPDDWIDNDLEENQE